MITKFFIINNIGITSLFAYRSSYCFIYIHFVSILTINDISPVSITYIYIYCVSLSVSSSIKRLPKTAIALESHQRSSSFLQFVIYQNMAKVNLNSIASALFFFTSVLLHRYTITNYYFTIIITSLYIYIMASSFNGHSYLPLSLLLRRRLVVRLIIPLDLLLLHVVSTRLLLRAIDIANEYGRGTAAAVITAWVAWLKERQIAFWEFRDVDIVSEGTRSSQNVKL